MVERRRLARGPAAHAARRRARVRRPARLLRAAARMAGSDAACVGGRRAPATPSARWRRCAARSRRKLRTASVQGCLHAPTGGYATLAWLGPPSPGMSILAHLEAALAATKQRLALLSRAFTETENTPAAVDAITHLGPPLCTAPSAARWAPSVATIGHGPVCGAAAARHAKFEDMGPVASFMAVERAIQGASTRTRARALGRAGKAHRLMLMRRLRAGGGGRRLDRRGGRGKPPSRFASTCAWLWRSTTTASASRRAAPTARTLWRPTRVPS